MRVTDEEEEVADTGTTEAELVATTAAAGDNSRDAYSFPSCGRVTAAAAAAEEEDALPPRPPLPLPLPLPPPPSRDSLPPLTLFFKSLPEPF